MHVTILGSGTSVPHPTRRPPAYLVQAGSVSLLVDAGAGCSTSLAAADVGLDGLSAIALTHLHPDHTVELVPILFALHNPLGPPRTADLPIWGPAGVAAHLDALRSIYGSWIDPRDAEIAPTELEPKQGFQLGPVTVTAYSVEHGGPCFAYRLEAAGAVLCLSGDSGPCEGLVEAARDADLLICECAALESDDATGHMSATDVGRLAATARARRVVLTHLYQHVVETDPLQRVREHYDGPSILGEDGMRLVVKTS